MKSKKKALNLRPPRNYDKLSLNDYYFDSNFVKYISKTDFFEKILFKFPKGIVHHIHLSASASKSEIVEVFYKMFGDEKRFSLKKKVQWKRKNEDTINNQTILFIKTYEEDRFQKGNFYHIPSYKLYYIKDFFKTAQIAETNNNATETLFKQNYIFIQEANICSLNPMKNKTLSIDVEQLAYFYLKHCPSNTIFTRNKYIIAAVTNLDNKSTRIMPLKSLEAKLKSGSVLNFIKIIKGNRQFLPKSYFKLLFNIKDMLSSGIWFNFESIFGFYNNFFENPNMIKDLLTIIVRKFKFMKISGVEFRQKNDVDKAFSVIRAIRAQFSAKGIETAFILPGRKVTSGSKFDETIKAIKNSNSSDISGIDFVGYEDDPFTGARNFFPLVLEGVLDPNNQANAQSRQQGNNPSSFKVLFQTLLSGKSFYLHAGETKYFPNYPITDKFMQKFYINDNLFHSALLPNVKRVGHGFAIANNDLLMSIFKQKKIHLEICPISNQVLLYWNVDQNPFLRLLRHGLSVSISSDDPGFFGYTGVAVDWFSVINQTGVKPSELYMLLKYSVLKASPNIAAKKETILDEIKQNFKAFIEDLNCKKLTKKELKFLEIKPKLFKIRKEIRLKRNINFLRIIKENAKYDVKKDEPLIDIYNKNSIKHYVNDYIAKMKKKN